MTESTHAELFDAIKAGELERVRALVTADPTLANLRSANGESAILTAVYHRQKEIANLLVARGATLTLFEACAAGEIDRVERLVDAGASVNAYSDDGWTPIHLAAFFGHARVAELLLAHEAYVRARSRNQTGNTPLHAALAANQTMVAGLLIGKGADLNAADAAGWRPLHLAAANNNVDLIKTLIAQGADPNATNTDGLTPLAVATQRGHREAVALLERSGCIRRAMHPRWLRCSSLKYSRRPASAGPRPVSSGRLKVRVAGNRICCEACRRHCAVEFRISEFSLTLAYPVTDDGTSTSGNS